MTPGVDEPTMPVVVDLDQVDLTGPRGVAWSLPRGGQLNANLVRLGPGERIAEHVNPDVDVFVHVIAGSGRLEVAGDTWRLRAGVVALIPVDRSRTIVADDRLLYLTVHRARAGLAIRGRR
jgi:quercetin dioxygenase-like cupin family protein